VGWCQMVPYDAVSASSSSALRLRKRSIRPLMVERAHVDPVMRIATVSFTPCSVA
jgi:hypothetical protein